MQVDEGGGCRVKEVSKYGLTDREGKWKREGGGL